MAGCAEDMYKYRLLIFHGQTDLLPEDHIKLSSLATSVVCKSKNKVWISAHCTHPSSATCAELAPHKIPCRKVLLGRDAAYVCNNLQRWELRVVARFQL